MGVSAPVLLFEAFGGLLIALVVTLPRMAAFLSSSQLLTSSSAPRLARMGVVLILALAAAPIQMAHVDAIPREPFAFAALFAKEWLVGFLLGYGVGWLFWSIQAAGGLIDNQRGAAIAASIDPLQGHESSPLGNLFSQGFITYFFASGGFLMLTGLFMQSYVLWPVTNAIPLPSPDLPRTALAILDHGMRLALVLAAPVLVVMFLSEFALALVSRFAPQVQVFILAMPIKSGLAIFMLIFYFHTLFDVTIREAGWIEGYFTDFYTILTPAPGGR